MERRFDAVGIGLNSVDFLCVVPRFPEFNSKTPMDSFSQQGGGQVATAMVALSQLGLRTAYIGAVGDDRLGEFSLASLRAEGVNVEGVVLKPGRRTQCAVILIDRGSGERTIVWGRDAALEPRDLLQDLVTSGRCLLLDGYALEAEIQAARWAREAGMAVLLDAEEVKPETRELLSLTDVVIAGEDFPSRFTGYGDLREALQAIRAAGPAVAAVTLGAEGALAFDGERFIESPGFSVPAADTTGAGDVFHAGYGYGYLKGWDLERTLSFANAFAALSCRAVGARSGIPTLSEVEDLMRRQARTKGP